ncbi:MAG: ATP synthase subunit I [Lachnospiraceae bacterium]|nr:ATP synthase subunit I [Lachnospiraceae bacterium]
MNAKINEKLSEILAGILLSGGIMQILFFAAAYFYRPFWGSRVPFSAGLWIGVAVSVALAVHMYRSIGRALEMEQDAAERYMRRVYLIRMAVIFAMAAVIWYTKAASVVAAFLGVFCTVFGTHLQPFIHFVSLRINRGRRNM